MNDPKNEPAKNDQNPMPEILANREKMDSVRRDVNKRHRNEKLFRQFCLVVAGCSIALLAALLISIFYQGSSRLTWEFFTNPPSSITDEAGFFPAIMGSVWLLVLCALFTLPLGVASAVMLEEFVPRNKTVRKALSFMQLNISNLAGVPSVVYGIIGLTAFAMMFELFGNPMDPSVEIGTVYFDQYYNESDRVVKVPVDDAGAPVAELKNGMTVLSAKREEITLNLIPASAAWPADPELGARSLREGDQPGRISDRSWYYMRLPFGRGVLTGALTLMLVVLPIIIIASQEALRAVPSSLRDGACGLGATRWQTVWRVTLPAATPSIMTATILAMSRAIGEAAPLLMIAGIVYITYAPGNLMDSFTAMPLQVYNWAGRPQEEFHQLAAGGIIVLLAVLLLFNGTAIWIRQKFQKRLG